MNKQNVVDTYNENYPALRRKKISTRATNLKTLCEVREGHQIRAYTMRVHLREVPRVVKFMDTERRTVVGRGCREGRGAEFVFNGCGVSVLCRRKALWGGM